MHYKNIIVGAGFAGLYFAHKFRLDNFIILERENRVGGRVYNFEWNGQQISMGGGILRNNDKHTIKLAEEFGLKTTQSNSKYYFIDLEGSIPNEELYYEANKVIINYLKKIFITHKDEIKRLELTFRQFLFEYLEYHIAQTIVSNLLYFSYLDSDVETIFNEKIYQLMRIEPFISRYILPNGYTGLLDKLVESVGKSNIKLNITVTNIYKSGNKYVINCSNNLTFTCDKLILATEKNPKINIEIKEVNELYEMFGSCPYIRSYGFWNLGHNITNSIKTQNYPGKIIKINDKLLMTCYTECIRAKQLNDFFTNKKKDDQIKIIHELLINSGIQIEKPDDFIYKLWEVGSHYPKPNFDYNLITSKIKDLAKNSNIYLVGEVFSDCNGWVNCALESVDRLYVDLIYK
jgi:hypothetical protein